MSIVSEDRVHKNIYHYETKLSCLWQKFILKGKAG